VQGRAVAIAEKQWCAMLSVWVCEQWQREIVLKNAWKLRVIVGR